MAATVLRQLKYVLNKRSTGYGQNLWASLDILSAGTKVKC